jgi:hypothetical protein
MADISSSGLTSRFGDLDDDTSEENVRHAVREMYHEDHPDLQAGDYAEHPDAWIDCSFDDGSVYLLIIQRFGKLRLEKRFDQGDIDPAESFELENVDEERCLQLCMRMVAGDVQSVRAAPWISCNS